MTKGEMCQRLAALADDWAELAEGYSQIQTAYVHPEGALINPALESIARHQCSLAEAKAFVYAVTSEALRLMLWEDETDGKQRDT